MPILMVYLVIELSGKCGYRSNKTIKTNRESTDRKVIVGV